MELSFTLIAVRSAPTEGWPLWGIRAHIKVA